jgi:hypothetical protein
MLPRQEAARTNVPPPVSGAARRERPNVHTRPDIEISKRIVPLFDRRAFFLAINVLL